MMAGYMGQGAQLGAPLGEFRAGSARIWYGIGALILIVLGVFLVLSGATATDPGGMIALIVVGIVLIGLSAYPIWRIITSFGAAVQLYEGGFSATQRGKTTMAAWSDVNTITQRIIQQRYYGIPVWTSYDYRLTLANGQRLRFNETLGKVRQMGETMQRQITRVLTPRALDALRSGATLPFGKLSLNPMGISNGSETLPWSEISNINAVSGSLIIGKVGKRLRWASAAIAKMPNAFVFLQVVDYMRRSGGQFPR